MRAIALVALLSFSCGGARTGHDPAGPGGHAFQLPELVGGWRWLLRTSEAGTTRVEEETWRFRRVPGDSNRLTGRYLRTVDVTSDDGTPFQCNQRSAYRQRATFDVELTLTGDGFSIEEVASRAEPSPCDHGFRNLAKYEADLRGNRLTLRWNGGTQTLWQLDEVEQELPDDPWPAKPTLAGPWRWDAISYDDDGNLREEHEWWQLTPRGERRLDATYRRRVITKSSDTKPVPCAKASGWSFDDGYVLDGVVEEEHWHFHELAAEPGDHPCLRPTPRRALDEATAELLGDYLVLEWRGKRRQILYRAQ